MPRALLPTLLMLGTALAVPQWAEATPFFARRYEYSCNNCHQGHYPRLNSFGRMFRENGYQLPKGAEDAIRARRNIEPGTVEEALSIFKEVPLGFRGQVFGVIPVDGEAQERPAYENKIFTYLFGGGSLGEDYSAYFSWTPFPSAMLHKAAVGFHNVASETLGEGTLHFRAGSLLLLDFQRPSHRGLFASPDAAEAVTVGLNGFSLDINQLGVQVYGRPGWGPFFYEISVVAGDPGDGTERDDWKDLWARVTYRLFQNTDHELTPGLFGYRGRSDIVSELGGVTLAQRDDFWILGAELEGDIGPFNLSGMGYYRHHTDAMPDGTSVTLYGVRGEAVWLLGRRYVASVKYAQVLSSDDPSLDQATIGPHLTYLPAPNIQFTAAYRHNLSDYKMGSVLLVLEGVF